MKKRGRGIACMFYPLGFTSYPNPSSAFVKVNPDGTAVVLTGAADVGQGSTTVLAQIAAEELGIPYEHVTLVTADTERTPMDAGSVASRVTYIMGNAIRKAAAQCKEILFQCAEQELGVMREGLEAADGVIRLKAFPEKALPIGEVARKSELLKGRPAVGSGTYNPPTTFLDPETGHGKPYATYVYAAQVAEVEVDTETGEVDLLKMYAVHDCGTAVNPMFVEGQVSGGISMGVGYGLLEELVTKDGYVINGNLRDYVIPTILDSPDIEVDLVQEPEPTGPFGAKGVGEPVLLPTAPAIVNAIYDAVGVRIRSLPATPEKILKALKESQS